MEPGSDGALSDARRELQEPVVLDGDGGAELFLTREEAERYAEPVDIQGDVYVAYDAAGRRLRLTVSPDGQHGRLSLPNVPEDGSTELAAALRTMLSHLAAVRAVPFDAGALPDQPLERLVGLGRAYASR